MLWQRVLGLVGTVVEKVAFDEDADAIVVSVRPRQGGGDGVGGAVVELGGMTGARDAAGGGRST